MVRLPTPGGDDNIWGDILNEFLRVAHNANGSIKNISQSQVNGLVEALSGKLDQAAIDGKANDDRTVHKDVTDETITGNLYFPQQPGRTGQIIMRAVNDPGGFVQKNIVFQDEGVLSRGGPVWVDSTGRVQAWFGWHDQIPGGSSHHGVEVKTAADPNGASPNVLVTRFRLRSDADQTQAAFYSCEMVYIENGIYSPDTQFGITFNTPQSGSVAAGTSSGIYELGKLTVNVDNAGLATMDIAAGLDNTTGGRIRVFRDSNVPTATFVIYAADGSATQVFAVDAKTGALTMAGRLQYRTTTNIPMFDQRATLDGSNHTVIDNDVLTVDTSHNATVRFFRNTSTSQTRRFRILKGDGTDTDSFVVDAGSGDVTVTGNLNITGSMSANNFFDEFELRRSSNVSTMSRLLASTNLSLNSGTIYGALAFAKIAGSFTKIRFATGSGTFPTITDLRLCVYNSSNLLLAATTNLSGTVTSNSTLYDNLALDSTVTTTVSQQLYLAVAYVGSAAIPVRGSGITTGMPALTPVIAKTQTYAGGTPSTLGSGNTGNIPWIELVP